MRGPARGRSAKKWKQFLGSLIVTITVTLVVTSALVFAQVPKVDPGGATATIAIEKKQRDSGLAVQKAEALPPTAVAKPAAAVIGARVFRQQANLENQIQQYMRQARPIVRAELIFVRNVCQLDTENFRRINRDIEAAFKDVAKTYVEAQQQGRVRVIGGVRSSLAVDGLTLLHEAFASVMKRDLTPERFSHYQAEVEKRDANRKQSAVHFLVDAIDRDLYFSGAQRLKLTESLLSHWDESWSMSLEYLLYGNQFYPQGVDAFVTPFLDATQKKIWQGTQKVGGIGGLGGVLGNFMTDNDALEIELGEARKVEPAKNAPMPALEALRVQMRRVETKEAVARPPATPK